MFMVLSERWTHLLTVQLLELYQTNTLEICLPSVRSLQQALLLLPVSTINTMCTKLLENNLSYSVVSLPNEQSSGQAVNLETGLCTVCKTGTQLSHINFSVTCLCLYHGTYALLLEESIKNLKVFIFQLL